MVVSYEWAVPVHSISFWGPERAPGAKHAPAKPGNRKRFEVRLEKAGEILNEVETLLAASEFEVVDVECVGSSRGTVVRIFVDKPEGVSLEDCARVSRAVGDHFEARSTFRGRYVLEVSSPGVDRPLKRPRDFQRFRGETAQVSTYEKIDGRHNHLGVLEGYDEARDEVRLRDSDGNLIGIPLGAVKKAHLKRDPWDRDPRTGSRGNE